jgi:hypothetical protein
LPGWSPLPDRLADLVRDQHQLQLTAATTAFWQRTRTRFGLEHCAVQPVRPATPQTLATDPDACWVFVVDNLNTHCGEELVRMVARKLEIDDEILGQAKKWGILKTMQTRRAFLSDPTHPIRFVHIPKHSSWLNQVEVIFGIISRRVMRGGSVTSLGDLTQKIRAFINYFNRTLEKPMNLTYNGRPTRNKKKERPKNWRESRESRTLAQKIALVTGQF